MSADQDDVDAAAGVLAEILVSQWEHGLAEGPRASSMQHDALSREQNGDDGPALGENEHRT